MEKEKLFESLDGLLAYDTGATDSGIKNEVLREEVKMYLDSLDENGFNVILATFIKEFYVCEEAVEKGYGIEDVSLFIRWLDQFMGIEL